MHKRISRALIHISWFALVSVIVITTMLISLIWVTSSNLDDLRPKVLEWVHVTTGQPIEVENLAVEWRGIIPHLNLTDIEVLDQNSHKSLTHLDQANLSIDLYHSLINWKPTVGHLELSGLNVDLLHKKDGTVSLLELTTEASSGDEFTRWLLEQPHLKITNSKIRWHEKEQQHQPISLSNVDLELTNKSLTNTHHLVGSTILDNNEGGVEFQLSITGDPQTSDWDAVLNLTTQEFNFSSYLPADINEKLQMALQADTFSLDHARLNSSTNISWIKADISDVKGDFSLKSATPIYSISGEFTAKKTPAKNWLLTTPEVTIVAQDHQWQPFSIGFLIPADFSQENPAIDAAINNLKVEDMLTLSPELIKNSVDNFKPKGVLNNLRIQYDQKNTQMPILIDGEFSNVQTLAYEKIPGFNNLSGKFHSNMDLFSVDLDSRNLIVNSLSKIGELDPPIRLEKLAGEMNWTKLDQGWNISIPQLTLSNTDLEFQLTGMIKNDSVSSPFLDLQGTFFRGNVEPAVKSIPSNLLQHVVKEWLNRSILSGHLTGGNAIFRGKLDEFPFENDQQGLFEVRLNAEDGILDYFEGWPRIEEITAEVLFNSHKMIITSPSAKINGAEVSNVTVEIPELNTKKHHLLITGNAKGDMKQGLHFINNSPLRSTVGKQFDHMKISGILNLDLNIDIPISNPNRLKIQGKVHLRKNTLQLESLDIKIKGLTGDFIFDQNSRQAKDLKARLYESAISIDLDINKSKKDPKSDVRISGLADKNYITNRMLQVGMQRDQLKVLESINGTTAWQAQLAMPSNIGSLNEEIGLVITSNLKGLNIHAPAPLGKDNSEERSLKISTTLSKQVNRQIGFEYGQIVKGKIRVASDEIDNTHVKNIELYFGKGKLPGYNDKKYFVHAEGNIPKVDVSAWNDFIDRHTDKNSLTTPTEDLLTFTISIDHLIAADQSFKNNHVLGMSTAKTWELQIENKSTSGSISLPYNLKTQAVKADFEQLSIASEKDKKQSEQLNPKDIPEMFITSKQFQYNDLKLGSLELHTQPVSNGLSIGKLTLSSPAVAVDVKGDWINQKNNQRSKFIINANGPTLRPMLEQFGFGVSGIEGGQTNISIDAAWNGAPAEFDLAKTKGKLHLDVGEGRFAEVKNNVGKVFGLLSIQSLGRRLSLDFDDIFDEGFTFDKISGDFDIDKSNAYTNNLEMTGPSANINVSGRVGLSKQDYDQLITITPSVADSLPVASALFGPVGAGVGAAILIVEKIIPAIPNAIDKVLEMQYTLKGSWENPLVEQLKIVKNNQNATGFPSN